MELDDPEENSNSTPLERELKTLRQLTEGPNVGAAIDAIENKVYYYKTVYHFLALRLVNSSGTRRPGHYDTVNKRL